MSEANSNPASINALRYNLETSFMAPVSAVDSALGVHETFLERVGLPEEHELSIADQHRHDKVSEYQLVSTFVDWEGDAATVCNAPISVRVYEPGLVARGIARIRRREPSATVTVVANGYGPGGGGIHQEPNGAPVTPTPTPAPVPSSPLVHA